MDNEEKLKELIRRVEELELVNDYKVFTAYMGHLNRPDVYRCIEIGVAEYFNIPFGVFYQRLLIGNKTGWSGNGIAKDPVELSGADDRVIVAKNCLYGILHIDFHIPIVRLSEYYNVNAQNYIRDWKQRHIRLFESGKTVVGKHDEAYRSYWIGCYRTCIAVAQREGLYDQLVAKLVNEGQTPEKLIKWRINS